MIEIHNKSIKKTVQTSRIISKIKGKTEGPTIVFFAGVHGNEKAGVFAINDTISKLDKNLVNGTIYAIAGNLKALELNRRYIDADLNRIWTMEIMNSLNDKAEFNTEENELVELHRILKDILLLEKGPFYFIDLHTTSGKTLPFITINDALINRKFSKQFPVPIVLGIEEYLNGPILSFINQQGYVSLGFESGQHEDIESISNAIAFINLTLVFSGNIAIENMKLFNLYYNQLWRASNKLQQIFEIIYLFKIKPGIRFKMLDGFRSFQKIKKGTILAENNNTEIKSSYNAKVFMPLYQEEGNEGFFLIRRIPPLMLKLSEIVRRAKADNLFVLLPGISWDSKQKHTLRVNLKVARFFAKQIFHLFGYRNQVIDKTHLRLFSRERIAKVKMYSNETWYK